jgi:hypothetical protein
LFDAAEAPSEHTEAAPGKLPKTDILSGASTASPLALVSSDVSPAAGKHIEGALPKTPSPAPKTDIPSGASTASPLHLVSEDSSPAASKHIEDAPEILASPTPSVIPAEAEAPGTVTVDLTYVGFAPIVTLFKLPTNLTPQSTPDELEQRTKNRAATLNFANQVLTGLSTAPASSKISGYLATMLRVVVSQYEASSAHIPLGLAPMDHHPTPITWDAVCRLGSMGE